ncbi:hypothetical protein [Novosphingobium kaempferiae]|uniref:hypothetical protein n=1 Tax=Novosphingobium kaempferiae TaxID=2896849 RepID=UPI001E65CE11|nr:hypothetical protein [Novosphingobium kaempferiae]
MKALLKKLALGAALSASVLAASSPAEARDRYYGRGDNTAAVAIGAGVIGLALGAALADRDDRYYNDRGYWGSRRYVTVRDRPGYYYYYDGYPNRYYRDRYYSRDYSRWYRDRDRWDRGRDRWDRGRDWRSDRRWDRRDRRWDRRDDRWDRRDYRRR